MTKPPIAPGPPASKVAPEEKNLERHLKTHPPAPPPLAASEVARLGWPHQSWMSPGLQPAYIHADTALALTFAHHNTHCVPLEPGIPMRAYGNTIWVASSDEGQCVAISFDWAAIERGVLAIADPFRICSNIWPADEDGAPFSESGRFRILNTLVWQLKWQSVVMEHLPESLVNTWAAEQLAA